MRISIAYSPDTDDAFMVEALIEKKIDTLGYKFEFISKDIQELNELACSEVYDITAVSIAAYPSIADKYMLLESGASIGTNYGPKLVCRQDNLTKYNSAKDLKDKRIAIPGKNTSAYFAAWHLVEGFDPVPMRFDKISKAVLEGDVDAGLLIHELQLNPEEEDLATIADIGKLWFEEFNLPLPLGANAIRRNLGADHIDKLSKLYHQSILWALEHREEAIRKALKSTGRDLTDAEADRYISMYVNNDTVEMNEDVKKGIDLLFNLAQKNSLCPNFEKLPFSL